MHIITLLNDDETFTDSNNTNVLAVSEDDINPHEDTTTAIEDALRDEQYSHVVALEVVEGVLIINISDSSGVQVAIDDERTLLDENDVMQRTLGAFPNAEVGQDSDGQYVVYTNLTNRNGQVIDMDDLNEEGA